MRRGILVVVLLLVLAGCGGAATPEAVSLPEGDAERGADLFNTSIGDAPTCGTCHAISDESRVGPNMIGYGARAGTRVEGQSAEAYTYNSIAHPADYIVEGFSNVMYTQYETKLSAQQIADLIAFLLSQ
jgi:cytochrome c553